VACFGPLVVFVWRLVKHFSKVCCVVACLAYAWCHFEFALGCESVHPSLPIKIDRELHLVDGITHIAGFN